MRCTVLVRRLVLAAMYAAAATAAASDDGGGIARDVGQGVGTAAGNVSSGMKSAAHGVAGAASSAASKAAGAAKDVAAGAREGFADGGAAGETPVTGAGVQLTDAKIAAIAVTANKVDIDAGRLAMRKSRNVAVKDFASEMISDHTSANKQAVTLARRLGVSPEENDFSRALAQGGQDNLANLKPLTGPEFDRAYAEHEVVYHQQVLEALDKKLIRGAQDADLKSLLESVREMVKAHLDHAESLYESFSK